MAGEVELVVVIGSPVRRATEEAAVAAIAGFTVMNDVSLRLVAHVASNAEALGNLVRWAATREPTPMYASAEARAAGIDRGLTMRPDELDDWLRRSASDLSSSMRQLEDAQWEAEVVTSTGRSPTVPPGSPGAGTVSTAPRISTLGYSSSRSCGRVPRAPGRGRRTGLERCPCTVASCMVQERCAVTRA